MSEPYSKRLCRHRQMAGLSLRQLGAQLGISFSTLARIERGAGEPDRHTRHQLERWLDPTATQSPCKCPRCAGERPGNLAALEARLTLLEQRIDNLEQCRGNWLHGQER